MTQINRMDLEQFRRDGWLMEVNRQFFHPHGLALEVRTDETGQVVAISGVWDYRDDPEGMVFGDLGPPDQVRADAIRAERDRHRNAREALFGVLDTDIEPIGWVYPKETVAE